MKFINSCLIVLIALVISGCTVTNIDAGSKNSSDSPLTTYDPNDFDIFHDVATNPGTLEITADCARLMTDNQRSTLLVWPEPTAWNAERQVIEFVSPFGERMELRTGDRLTAGGYVAVVFTKDDSGEPDIGAPEYVLPPSPDCEADSDSVFVLHSIGLLDE